MKLVRYESPELLLGAFASTPDEVNTFEDIADMTAQNLDGDEVICSPTEMVESIRKMGMWGFADAESTVHFWVDPNASPADVMFFLGHEIGHLSGTALPQVGKPEDIAEEQRADEYGNAAKLAYQWMNELVGGNP